MLYHRYLAPVPLSIQELAKSANVEERQIRRRLELGLRLLVDLVRRAEKTAHDYEQANYKRRYLPPAEHSKLFGLEPTLAHLDHSLRDPTQAPFISLEGLGGIGKTTLARAVAYRLAAQNHFAGILWAQAKPQQMNDQGELKPVANAAITSEGILAQLAAQLGVTEFWGMTLADLQARLRAIWANHPYLVVIDNLETVEDATELLPILHSIAGQSRFLLTSRHTLRYYPFVYTFSVPELSLPDSLALMRYEIHRKQSCPAPADAMLILIYEAIGGLPLAIRLVTAQIGRLPLATILLDLRQARAQMPGRMYTYIYQRAWRLLSDSAKHLLLSMLFVDPAGEEASWLGNMSAYSLDKVQQALVELMDYSLVEMNGVLEQPLYRLHRLTHTFLQTQILAKWESDNESTN